MVYVTKLFLYDVPHHGRFSLKSPRNEEPDLGSLMVSYKDPIMKSKAKFINLVTYLDDKEAFGSMEGSWGRFQHETKKEKNSARGLGRDSTSG